MEITSRENEFTKVKSSKGNKKSTTILGDSMLKDIKLFNDEKFIAEPKIIY